MLSIICSYFQKTKDEIMVMEGDSKRLNGE